MRVRINGTVLLAFGLMALGCAQTPEIRVWEPWTRVIGDPFPVSPGKIAIHVTGETKPVLGSDSLLQEELSKRLRAMVARRGFEVSNDASLVLELTYRTERVEMPEVSNFSSFSSSQGVANGVEYSGYGILAARMVAASINEVSATQTMKVGVRYTHTVALSVKNVDGTVSWKGDSTWDSDGVDVLKEFGPALQMLIGHMPSTPKENPSVREVVKNKAANYYTIYCLHHEFRSAALPYPIYFLDMSSIKDPQALAAYLDLIETSEDALPTGASKLKNPLKITNWKKVRLAGRYTLLPSNKTVTAMVDLSGRSEGYFVKKCWIAEERESRDFDAEMKGWRAALAEYFNVFSGPSANLKQASSERR